MRNIVSDMRKQRMGMIQQPVRFFRFFIDLSIQKIEK